MSTDARRRLRGFTLLELAVVLAVLGLLLGMSLTPARMLEERRQLRQETQLLQTAHDAVVGYALQNQTRERVVHIKGAVDKTVTLRPGRPYLPCPDWNGDGYEDRMPEGQNGFIQGVEVNPAITITMTVILRTATFASATLSHLDWIDGNSGRSTYTLRRMQGLARLVAVAHFGSRARRLMGEPAHLLRRPRLLKRDFRF